jgi:hydroxypyruvate reductase
LRIIRAGHPEPDAGSFLAARAILDLLKECDARTLVIFLLSGGGSPLVELPLDPAITLGEMQELHRLLVRCGAPIDEINTVRKHLSAVKGGRLAAAASAAMKLTLGVTDVPAGRESALGSGPTIPDPTTVLDACRTIERYALLPKLPSAIRAKFDDPEKIPETPKAGEPAFARSRFLLLLGMNDLFHHAHRAAEAQGFKTVCDNSTDDWPLGPSADYLLAELARLAAANPGRRVAVIADGEVSSPVIGDGIGGRNSAFVLECAGKIAGIARKKIAILSAGTDGKDGSSPAAGAVADTETFARARALGLDPAEFARRSDSYNFFRALGDAVETGPTGNNLRDLRVLLAE